MNFDENCFYCSKNQDLNSIMIKICDLEVSTVYLFKEQTYKGRCNVVFKEHKSEITDLTEEEAAAFIKDVRKVAKAIQKIFNPDKINYGAFADTMQHLHFHIVPKYNGGPSWGKTFDMMPQPKTLLNEEGYSEVINRIKFNL
ncbi:HIT family protein [Clostridium saccharobutylicum]|uniref:Histidine triad (HIT) protein n=1 Tax=Clostridium saccharobutylicum DSM 13864 TaxID=1345695 RepID=U5MU42_CLOSA|nr:HIT family protein [Clostridium saccharobutylicum]AGX42932.1 histidine triad (HIT) protein [Clostridium saccharobutylicum DSM 13864]AQR90225.1 HIT domain protein [Clostridium saccharobutylicum]AQS00131.1 HIT domain protein [Clostridium saccharobutylicum]AQS09928.1 HIT domain protein [Clostridium saccharobutylicum]AQS14114.1 HIT domain protein [Clostridium saccharobutylicum]